MIYNGFINDSSEIKDTVKAVLDSIESKVHLESQTKYNVELVLRELLNNGIIYSHSRIKFMIKMCGCGIKAAVIDSGNGFDYSKYPTICVFRKMEGVYSSLHIFVKNSLTTEKGILLPFG